MPFRSPFQLLKAGQRRTHSNSRLERVVAARETLSEDFFGGWEPGDAELFSRYLQAGESEDGYYVDAFGIRTRADFHPWAKHLDGSVQCDIPIPDDGVRAEAIEYFAVLHSLETAGRSYSIAELGASYAPWACFGGVLAHRMGKQISLVAAEASEFFFGLIEEHLAVNGIDRSNCDIKLINGAVGTGRGISYFPKVSSASENGGQAVEAPVATDYVGRDVEFDEVPTYPLEDILQPGITDMLHVDIQGAESSVLAGAMDMLNEHVRTTFIGTHSRKIEGELVELFNAQGWRLIRERPTKFGYFAGRPDIVGWTTRDGGQYWVNPAFDAVSSLTGAETGTI